MSSAGALQLARKYSQSKASSLAQVGAVSIPLGLMALATGASLGLGLALATGAAVLLGALMVLENSNRIVIDHDALVVQASVLLRRYDRDRIEQARVEVLGPRQWLTLEVLLFNPLYFFRKTASLRFAYRKEKGGYREVFIAVDDPADYVELLSR